MGAWGEGIFENDCAADLVDEVIDAPADEVAAMIDATFDAVLEPEDPYLDVDEVSRGLAAVALLVADRDPSVLADSAHPEELPQVLAAAAVALDERRAARAHAVLDRALDPEDNEWYELWDEADEDAIAAVSAPISSLRALLPPATHVRRPHPPP